MSSSTQAATQGTASAVSIDQALAAWADEMTARGCAPGSVGRMTACVAKAAEWAGWATVGQESYGTATAYLAHRRREGWSGPTHDQAASSLRVFGDFCRRSGWVAANPLQDIRSCNEPNDGGAGVLTPEQARALIVAGLIRHGKSKRARGSGPLFWAVMMHTGLRYSEACSLRWANIEGLGEPGACIWTDPKWKGNKGGRRERIVLSPMLNTLLAAWRTMNPLPAVLPRPPTSDAWHLDRESAGIPETTPKGESIVPHACRKSYATWMREGGADEATVSRMLRHAPSMSRDRYMRAGDKEEAEERAAALLLPNLWPGDNPSFSEALRFSATHWQSSLANGVDLGDIGGATSEQKAPMSPITPTNKPHRVGLLPTDVALGPSAPVGLVSGGESPFGGPVNPEGNG